MESKNGVNILRHDISELLKKLTYRELKLVFNFIKGILTKE